MVSTFFWFWAEKKDLRRQFFFRVVTSAVRARRGIVWGKIFFTKCSIFCHHIWSISDSFCLLGENLLKCVKTTTYMYNAEVLRKINFENSFFQINFGLWANCLRLLAKHWSMIFQNCSLQVQWNNIRNFQGQKDYWLSVFRLWAEILYSWPKNFGKVAKERFNCPDQQFEKNMLEVNYFFVTFLEHRLSFSLLLTKKLAGVSKHFLKCREEETSGKKIEQFFLIIFGN